MQKLTEKRPYEKPVLEECGSMVESTLCPPDGSTLGIKFDPKPGHGHGHGGGWGWGWGR
jgi:hypothetical protein